MGKEGRSAHGREGGAGRVTIPGALGETIDSSVKGHRSSIDGGAGNPRESRAQAAVVATGIAWRSAKPSSSRCQCLSSGSPRFQQR